MIGQPFKRLRLAKQAEVGKQLEDMQQHRVTEESNSSSPSPVVHVWKKTKDLCFCANYRKLNDITKKDCFPLPEIDDTLDTLTGAKWFSILDLKNTYWHPNDKKRMAYSIGQGL
jgi:hypothetical protein